MRFFAKKSEEGQILLVIVLAAVISLTVGLSAVSRTITNTRIATEEANSQKALSAAEAGVEQLARNPTPGQTLSNSNLQNGAGFSASTTQVAASANQPILVNGGSSVLQDDGADIWLSNYPTYSAPSNVALTIYWTDNDRNDCTHNAAIEVVLVSGSLASPNISRYAYDSCAAERDNGFTAVAATNTTIQGKTFDRRVTLPVVNNVFIARVIPLYANTSLAVSGSVNLPAQGYLIQSTGTAGDTSRTVRVYRGYPKVPNEFFAYGIFQP